ncbi:2,3-diketo-L-gulonate TRAP transporter, large permease protein [Escherichia coli]|uniref:2,3-diketo-L-gulonate TRAP transporter, large permease protein n=1 Tax=Escherichia coli TaxID=562 RepID=A0A376VA36_ECOLX|nr:2,3-diketo-L-gulonate TRAP transporter, large permease protein [Escherichia coli]
MMMGATLMLTWWWQASRLNLPRQQKATMQEIWHSFVSGIWALFLPVIIIGGFRSGLFTPTEAGAVAAFYALFVATVIYREMTFATLWHVLIGAAKTTSVVMFLVASAQVSAWLITIAELPMMVSDLLATAGRFTASAVYRHYGGYPDCRHGHGFNADGINSYPGINAFS